VTRCTSSLVKFCPAMHRGATFCHFTTFCNFCVLSTPRHAMCLHHGIGTVVSTPRHRHRRVYTTASASSCLHHGMQCVYTTACRGVDTTMPWCRHHGIVVCLHHDAVVSTPQCRGVDTTALWCRHHGMPCMQCL